MKSVYVANLLTVLLAAVQAGPETRIIGGVKADMGEWPWQLALYVGGRFNCGGSIVAATWGLTAAHCVGSLPSIYQIVAGTNTNNINCTASNCIVRRLTNATRHPNFTAVAPLGYPNDVAYMAWETPIKEGASGNITVRYARRATTDHQVGRNCYISGWGRQYDQGPAAVDLMEARVDVITKEECKKVWRNMVSDSQVCIRDSKNFSTGPCDGDSGGPLVCEVSPKNWELVGASSWGVARCNTSYPAVYTRISSFNSWLDSQARPKQ
ncbi:hypothetical protein HELRODRAFT_193208 [Helobdella robusta]|uniref:Peptidase S1 domain-containing protein n=1 Tax=Helobdella robusta TaxID=6412 RepID=T1FUR3_HELRO|nr:hypothetical protein HELRODRAFT_193208 [Helobdella robusta]ESN97468.1 hypothetical protein HELRODRAFT_193208 [Helobdella robusta]